MIARMIFALVQMKGGVGKSTIAVHLAAWLAARGRRVALLDADPQEGSSRWLAEAAPSIPTEALTDPDAILDRLPVLAAEADDVIADGPAGLAEASRALLLRCDVAILPVGPSVLDLRALADTARLVEQARSIRGGAPAAFVVLNRLQPHTILSREIAESAPGLGLTVASTVIRQRTALADCAGQGLLIDAMPGQVAREAAADFAALFQEIAPDAQAAPQAE